MATLQEYTSAVKLENRMLMCLGGDAGRIYKKKKGLRSKRMLWLLWRKTGMNVLRKNGIFGVNPFSSLTAGLVI